jgi:hypothetical protein
LRETREETADESPNAAAGVRPQESLPCDPDEPRHEQRSEEKCCGMDQQLTPELRLSAPAILETREKIRQERALP